MTEGYILSVTQLNEYVNTLLRNDVPFPYGAK